MSRVVLFAVAFAFWLALVGPDLPAAVPMAIVLAEGAVTVVLLVAGRLRR